MYDLIGDIHGYADELVQLLEALGYDKLQGVYRHPERTAIFLGDFIDRGPKIRQVLEIAQPMIEEGKALGVMGSQELNALAYHTEDPESPTEYLPCESVLSSMIWIPSTWKETQEPLPQENEWKSVTQLTL